MLLLVYYSRIIYQDQRDQREYRRLKNWLDLHILEVIKMFGSLHSGSYKKWLDLYILEVIKKWLDLFILEVIKNGWIFTFWVLSNCSNQLMICSDSYSY